MEAISAWPTWPIIAALLAAMFAADEIGFRMGRAPHREESEPSRTVSNALKASVFGLVAFLLGLSFSMTSSRHDARRKVVLDEANAVGTCYLRAGLLPRPFGDRIRDALRELTDARLRHFEAARDRSEFESTSREMDRLLDTVWGAVEEATRADRQAVLASQIVPAANDVIDLDTTRAWATVSHLPPAVFLLLVVSVLVSSLLIGHSSGQACRRHAGLWVAFNVLFSLVLFIVLDLDRPRRGFIQVDHTPLRELREAMK